ncbi:Mce family protein [Gordonia hirsuta DSM 44140 = NBRC 16056]|uniref:Mce family protein n=1 Tax=Gordonia hirsuta DSM 44140 = NBRC 16056 TaxID=1121927 RepID=L7L742_9ACTN|nr:MCE family protein [Gordonia hirsuta]GAC56551.1 Mce family protein [Gordonia hirsuta DSM 44140 = NBRC 16056]
MKISKSHRFRAAGVSAAMAAVIFGASGCGINVQQMPLPGGVSLGDDPREYKIEFSNILDLVPQSVVKKDGIPVGRVTKIEVPGDSWNALVYVKVKKNVDLSTEARAAVQQTNLLGEKFVALTDPDGANGAPRQNPSVPIATSRTSTTTDIEQLLGALSLVLNGGGISELKPIVTALNESMGGQEGNKEVRELLVNSEKLIRGLNEQRDNIVRAVDGVAVLSERAAAQTAQIERILDELPAGIAVLEEQRPQLVDLLVKLDKLGEVGTDILGKAHKAMINDLKALAPILTQLSTSVDDAITAAPLMLTHPFPDDILPAVHGDSTNLFMTVDLRLLNQLEALGVGQGTPRYQPPKVNPPKVDPRNPYVNGNGPRWGWPTISLLPPAPNSRPGPNTPPSGGTYPMNPAPKKSPSTKKPSTTKPSAAKPSAKKPASAPGFLDGPIALLGGPDAH